MSNHWKDTHTMFDAQAIYNDEIERGTEDPLRSTIFQALGAASVCWDGEGVFMDAEAKRIGNSLTDLIRTVTGTRSGDKAEVYQSGGKWRYRIIAPNGRIVDAPAGQGYTTRFGAKRAARRGRPGINVVILRTVR